MTPIRASNLAAYWPYNIYQDAAGKLHNLYNRIGGNLAPNGNEWKTEPLNITALAGSHLAIVPTSTNLSMISAPAGYTVFHQTPENKLTMTIPKLDAPDRPAAFYPPWLPTTFPDITIPNRAPIAAFSVARGGGSNL